MDVIMKSKQFHEPCAMMNNWDLYNVRNSCRVILTFFGNRHGVILTQHLMSFLSLKIEQHEPPKKESEFRCSRMVNRSCSTTGTVMLQIGISFEKKYEYQY
jgi:hypothetical protein